MKFASGLQKWWCVLFIISMAFFYSGCKKKSVEQLLQQGRVDRAVKYCADCESTKQKECFAKIAVYFFDSQDYKQAAEFYARAGDHTRVISCYLIGNALSDAETYYSQLPQENQKEGATLLAKSLYLQGDYIKAKQYYQKAGASQKVKQIEAKIPAFQLLATLNLEVQKYAQSEVRSKITRLKDTLKNYIYFDGYNEWRYGTKNQTDRDAATIFIKAHNILHEKMAPIFMENISKTLATSTWTQKNMDMLFFQQARLNRLMGLLKALDVIGSYRRFYMKYEVLLSPTPQPGESGYEATYKSAVEHATGLMETVTLSEKNTGASSLADLINDLDVDGEVLDYITGMLDNIRARIMELETRGKNIRKFNTAESLQTETMQSLANFLAGCNGVLQKIGKNEYPKANDLLLKTYNTCKKNITDLEKALNIPQMPGQQ
jgi:tetratricopeptide (TPR) repeat protein